MAKKKAVPVKKTTSSVKKKPVAKKKPAVAKKKTVTAGKKPAVKKIPKLIPPNMANDPHIKQTFGTVDMHSIDQLPPLAVNSIATDISNLSADCKELFNDNMNALQRKRKIGAGIRNYGFIDKVSDLASSNPRFAQFFDVEDLKNCLRNVEILRDFILALRAIERMMTNSMLIYSDDAYGFALIYYNMVKEMSKRGDPEAIELYKSLQVYFKRKHKPLSAEPTIKELEHDIHAVLHGTKDGTIEISGKSPKVIAGKRTVIDDVHKSKAMFKETEEGQVDNLK
ncbi:MAG: hypothetical protein LBH44_11710 [Treponema sp.]|jgi:hypothetical protein|nr:hypothetical protein [Treponema sp.]